MTDIAELRELEHKLAELKQLPERERLEADRAAKVKERERRAELESRLVGLANRYRLALNKSNLEIQELCQYFADVIERRQAIDRQGQELARVAQGVAEGRINAGETVLGSWGPDYEGNRLMLQAVTEAVLQEQNVRIGQIELKDTTDEARQLLALLGQFCNVRTAARPQNITNGKVLIVGHDGQEHWE